MPWPRNERGAVAGLKTTSYAENVVALAYAKRAGLHRGDVRQHRRTSCARAPAPTCSSVIDGRLVTPAARRPAAWPASPATSCSRSTDAVEERHPDGRASATPTRSFLTSTGRDVQPVDRIDGPRAGRPRPAHPAAAAAFAALAGPGPSTPDPHPTHDHHQTSAHESEYATGCRNVDRFGPIAERRPADQERGGGSERSSEVDGPTAVFDVGFVERVDERRSRRRREVLRQLDEPAGVALLEGPRRVWRSVIPAMTRGAAARAPRRRSLSRVVAGSRLPGVLGHVGELGVGRHQRLEHRRGRSGSSVPSSVVVVNGMTHAQRQRTGREADGEDQPARDPPPADPPRLPLLLGPLGVRGVAGRRTVGSLRRGRLRRGWGGGHAGVGHAAPPTCRAGAAGPR